MQWMWIDRSIMRGGETVASFDQSWLQERADVVVVGAPWLFRKEALGDWLAEVDGEERLRAASTSMWGMAWELTSPTGTYAVRRSSSFPSSVFELVADGSAVGEIASDAFWTYRPVLTAPDSMPDEEAAFVLWLVKRAVARAAAASA